MHATALPHVNAAANDTRSTLVTFTVMSSVACAGVVSLDLGRLDRVLEIAPTVFGGLTQRKVNDLSFNEDVFSLPVTLFWKLNGEPIATTHSPTSSLSSARLQSMPLAATGLIDEDGTEFAFSAGAGSITWAHQAATAFAEAAAREDRGQLAILLLGQPPLQRRVAGVDGLFQHPAIEMQPG